VNQGAIYSSNKFPQFKALECYTSRESEYSNYFNAPARGSAAWELSKLAKMSGLSGFGMPSTTINGNGTETCPADLPYCMSLHCEGFFGEKFLNKVPFAHAILIKMPHLNLFFSGSHGMEKGCMKVDELTPEIWCNFFTVLCRQDPKFYCRICQGDKCNDEPVEDDANAIGMEWIRSY
jgi:hypothetical protein